MELNYFDLIVGIIILLLGLKGIINGFFKELFGLIGIIGGIFVASRFGDYLGEGLSDAIFKFDSQAAISFTGFLITLLLFWLLMIGAGMLFKKMSAASGLGPFDRILGFVFGSGKFFLIASVIVYAVFNINAIRKNLEPAMESSTLFGVMVATGGYIMKIDTEKLSEDLNESVSEQVQITKEAMEKGVKNAEAVIEEVKKGMESNRSQEKGGE